MTKFEAGKTYSAKSVCDQNCLFTFKVVKRTAKSVWVIGGQIKEVSRRSISVHRVSLLRPVLCGHGGRRGPGGQRRLWVKTGVLPQRIYKEGLKSSVYAPNAAEAKVLNELEQGPWPTLIRDLKDKHPAPVTGDCQGIHLINKKTLRRRNCGASLVKLQANK